MSTDHHPPMQHPALAGVRAIGDGRLCTRAVSRSPRGAHEVAAAVAAQPGSGGRHRRPVRPITRGSPSIRPCRIVTRTGYPMTETTPPPGAARPRRLPRQHRHAARPITGRAPPRGTASANRARCAVVGEDRQPGRGPRLHSTRHVADADRCELNGGVVRSIARPPHCDHDPVARDGLRPQLTEGYVHSVGDVSESPLRGLPDVEQQRAATGQVTRRARVDLGDRVRASSCGSFLDAERVSHRGDRSTTGPACSSSASRSDSSSYAAGIDDLEPLPITTAAPPRPTTERWTEQLGATEQPSP